MLTYVDALPDIQSSAAGRPRLAMEGACNILKPAGGVKSRTSGQAAEVPRPSPTSQIMVMQASSVARLAGSLSRFFGGARWLERVAGGGMDGRLGYGTGVLCIA